MDRIPAVTVRLDEDGGVLDIDVEGHAQPGELIETSGRDAVAPFGDEQFKGRLRPWLADG